MNITPKRAAGLLLSAFMLTSCATRNYETSNTAPNYEREYKQAQRHCITLSEKFYQKGRVLSRIETNFEQRIKTAPRGQTVFFPPKAVQQAKSLVAQQDAIFSEMKEASKEAKKVYGRDKPRHCNTYPLNKSNDIRKILRKINKDESKAETTHAHPRAPGHSHPHVN